MHIKGYLANLKDRLTILKSDDINKYEIDLSNVIIDDKTMSKLDRYSNTFFPESGRWSSSCFRKDYDSFPCHLRDDEWLAKRLIFDNKICDISYNIVLKYVKTSDLFKRKRHDYEQKIVKWQIEFMLHGGEGWICDEEYGGDLTMILDKCDLGFRKGVIDTLTKIGLSIDAIEEGLEKNADIWRDILIERAFDAKFNPAFFSIYGENPNDLSIVDPKFKEYWIRLRKYEYFQEHRNSVIKYGNITDDMLIKDISNIKKYVDKKSKERLEEIENIKNPNIKKLRKK